jgi:hypothetical protein
MNFDSLTGEEARAGFLFIPATGLALESLSSVALSSIRSLEVYLKAAPAGTAEVFFALDTGSSLIDDRYIFQPLTFSENRTLSSSITWVRRPLFSSGHADQIGELRW